MFWVLMGFFASKKFDEIIILRKYRQYSTYRQTRRISRANNAVLEVIGLCSNYEDKQNKLAA